MSAEDFESTVNESVRVETLERRAESKIIWMASDVSKPVQSFHEEGMPGAVVTASRNGPRM